MKLKLRGFPNMGTMLSNTRDGKKFEVIINID